MFIGDVTLSAPAYACPRSLCLPCCRYSKSAVFDSQPKSTVGTPAYIAPEVLSRKQVRSAPVDLLPTRRLINRTHPPGPPGLVASIVLTSNLAEQRALRAPCCPCAVRRRDCRRVVLRGDAVRDAGGGIPL